MIFLLKKRNFHYNAISCNKKPSLLFGSGSHQLQSYKTKVKYCEWMHFKLRMERDSTPSESSLYAHHIRETRVRCVLFMFIVCQPAYACTFVSVRIERDAREKRVFEQETGRLNHRKRSSFSQTNFVF